jgi:hypothetical protein
MNDGALDMNSNGPPSPNGSDDEGWPTVLSYWRTLVAEAFDERRRAEVAECVRSISAAPPEWQAAVRGDAAAASGLVLRLKAPSRISVRVDLAMTILLNTAFGNAGAALVLSHGLRRMPLDPRRRARLATSWLVHNVCLEHRSRRGRASGRNDP